ncbi:Serpentine Receptor, class T [Caenorhabditis elegans]|uniref:Serpentine Receptor, class T n=1 Tax=Caenorhabditis elegans TaxID=6239 RepID=Q9N526_CAEEL|nr:Serpentine Receptor, class T [Caenorhabditis elegans]CCD61790.1 Serpentine Receptor, class T [Caenorhabditis elegans]|eukprot:NP_503129.2 Serpentine Receptor, class T [Caenorhabditis elegans]
MNSLLIYGSVQANPLYNCSAKPASQWTDELGTQRIFLGVILIIFGIIVEILYVPCLGAIYKKKLLQHSCYKIMFLLGITDMLTTCTATILSGYLLTVGAVFCTYPELIYVAGCFALGGWVSSCAWTLLLVINRISDMIAPRISDFLFSGNRTWIVALIPIPYTLSVMFFTPAIIFNSTVMAWIGDPLIYEERAQDYYNPIQNLNNVVFISGTIVLYGAYCFFMAKKTMGYKVSAGKNVFIQSTLICSINCSSALVYSSMMFHKPNEYIVLFGELAWSFVHGCPAIIYLTMNKTVRQEVLRWIRRKNPAVQDSDKYTANSLEHRSRNTL